MASFGKKTQAPEVAEAFDSEIKDKVILLTGTSPASIATAAAKSIAPHLPKLIILASRNIEKLRLCEESIKSIAPTTAIRLLELDLDSLTSTEKAAREVLSWKLPSLDVLVNSAGIMATPYRKTKDGFESQFGIGHLGPFALTQILMPLLLKSKARIVMVTSSGHAVVQPNWADPGFNDGKDYNPWVAYAAEKSGNCNMALSLAEKYGSQGLTAFSVMPGVTRSGIFDYLDHEGLQIFVKNGAMTEDFQPIESSDFVPWKTVEGCAASLVVAAFSPDIVGSNGGYIIDCHIANDQLAEWINKEEAEKLWQLSERLVAQGHP